MDTRKSEKMKNRLPLNLGKSKEPLYGLPQDVKFCSRCSYSNQKPNSTREFSHVKESRKETVEFDKDGVCSACLISDKKKEVDWTDRESQLVDLCNRYRKNNGEYDCLVPGSGGKDSFYTSFVLKYKYGMNPLTITWAPHLYTSWGWDNFQSWIHSGFDNQLYTPNGKVHRVLTRLALEKLFHPFQPFMMGQMLLPPRIAAEMKIPLVFYGENPIEYGNQIGTGLSSPKKDPEKFTRVDQEELYIAGTSHSELVSEYGLTALDLHPYSPLDPNKYPTDSIEVQYLGYYLPWHPQELYYFAVENGGFKASPERTTGSYSKYSSIDDKMDDFHYYCTYIKFGIGRATYDSAQEIRNGEISREEAVSLVKKYDGEYPSRFEKECFEYLSLNLKSFPVAAKNFEEPVLSKQYFDNLTDSFRSNHLWKKEQDQWKLRHTIYD